MAHQRNVSVLLSLLVFFGLAVGGYCGLGRLECKNLSPDSCAFAVDSHGSRCVLETSVGENGVKNYHCQRSDFRSSTHEEYIENESCVKACGVNRMTVGISTDEFFLPGFAETLCSAGCQAHCANIVDFFSSIVSSVSEGASLGKFCNELLAYQGHRRQMRGNALSTSELAALNGIAPSASFAQGPSSSFPSDSAPAPSSFSNGFNTGAAGPSENSEAPTSQFSFFF